MVSAPTSSCAPRPDPAPADGAGLPQLPRPHHRACEYASIARLDAHRRHAGEARHHWNDRVRPPGSPTLFELAHRAATRQPWWPGSRSSRRWRGPAASTGAPSPTRPPPTRRSPTPRCGDRSSTPRRSVRHLRASTVGHRHGWGSERQLEAIARADSAIGRMVSALRRRRLLDSTLILVTADHGGSGTAMEPAIRSAAASPGSRPDRASAATSIWDRLDRGHRHRGHLRDSLSRAGGRDPEPIDGRPIREILAPAPVPAGARD